MNAFARWTMMALFALPGTLRAQFDDGPPDGEGPRPRPPPEGRPWRDGPGPENPMRQWMQQLKDNEPAEFERLRRLREEDPDAFREELGARAKHARMMGAMREHPGMVEAFRALPPEERIQLLNRLAQQDEPGRWSRRRPPELDTAEREIMEQARRFREAGDDAGREKAKQQLREKLSAAFDLRIKARETDIQQMETQLNRLKEKLQNRKTHREEIINQRLRELTEDKLWDW